MYNLMLTLLFHLAIISIFGFILSTMFEKLNLLNNRIKIKSKKVTQKILDELDMKIFNLGRTKLNIGDELRVILNDDKRLRGVLLGAKKKTNEICLLTKDDEIIQLSIGCIDRIKITSKYGRLF